MRPPASSRRECGMKRAAESESFVRVLLAALCDRIMTRVSSATADHPRVGPWRSPRSGPAPRQLQFGTETASQLSGLNMLDARGKSQRPPARE